MAGRLLRRRRRETPAQEATALERAESSLEEAKEAHREQARKRDQEREAVVGRLERLAGRDSNHLGALVLQALTERHGGDS